MAMQLLVHFTAYWHCEQWSLSDFVWKTTISSLSAKAGDVMAARTPTRQTAAIALTNTERSNMRVSLPVAWGTGSSGRIAFTLQRRPVASQAATQPHGRRSCEPRSPLSRRSMLWPGTPARGRRGSRARPACATMPRRAGFALSRVSRVRALGGQADNVQTSQLGIGDECQTTPPFSQFWHPG